MSIETMKQARDALDMACAKYGDVGNIGTDWGKWDAAATALRQAIEQAEKQAPVAWMQADQAELYVKECRDDVRGYTIPLYTAPQREWVGLTDEQIDDVYYCVEGGETALETWREQARAVEAMLKEKNT
jgi:hypothetical protein